MNEKFEKPEMTIILFANEDIIVTSTEGIPEEGTGDEVIIG